MSFNGFCPACGTEISRDRIVGESAVCSCGWSNNVGIERLERDQQKKTIIVFTIICSVMILGYGHLLNWGRHAFSIPVLKVAQMTGTISAEGLETVIEACVERARWSCVETAHYELFAKTRNSDVLARLAKLNLRLDRRAEAKTAFAAWAQSGGQDADAAYLYAELLNQSGERVMAADFYRKSIDASQDRLPVRATTALVRMLMQSQQYQDAYDLLVAFHESASNASTYMIAEREELERQHHVTKKIAAR